MAAEKQEQNMSTYYVKAPKNATHNPKSNMFLETAQGENNWTDGQREQQADVFLMKCLNNKSMKISMSMAEKDQSLIFQFQIVQSSPYTPEQTLSSPWWNHWSPSL